MRRTRLTIATILIGMVALQPIASAEIVQGVVLALNLDANSMSLTRVNPATGVSEEIKIVVRSNAEFKGVNSLSELKPGAEVRVDANKKGTTGLYEAKAIEAVSGITQPAEGQGQLSRGQGSESERTFVESQGSIVETISEGTSENKLGTQAKRSQGEPTFKSADEETTVT